MTNSVSLFWTELMLCLRPRALPQRTGQMASQRFDRMHESMTSLAQLPERGESLEQPVGRRLDAAGDEEDAGQH